MTADVKKGGSVIIAVVNEAGKELAVSKAITETATDQKVVWKKDWDYQILNKDNIRLKFIFSKAKLYSFSFERGGN